MKSELYVQIERLATQYPDWGYRRIARELGVKPTSVDRHLKTFRMSPQSEAPRIKPPEFRHKDGEATAEAVGFQIKTLPQLLAACKADMTMWRVKTWSANCWNVGAKWRDQNLKWKDGVMTGHAERRNEFIDHPLWQVKAQFEQRPGALVLNAFIEHFHEMAKSHSPKRWSSPPRQRGDSLLEVDIPDMHLSKLAWGQETRHGDYDSKIGAALFRSAVDYFCEQAKELNPSRILFPIGNDYFHADFSDSTTAGTRVDVDSRWQKMFLLGCDLAVKSLEKLSTIAPVDVLIVPGNHDGERCQYLGLYLKAWFRLNPHITIDAGPSPTKYYRFGKNLIGFNHGNEIKPTKLPLIMAREKPQDWAECNGRCEWHLGHFHREMLFEEVGVVVRFLSSLCGTDAWHSNKGFVGNRPRATSMTFDKDRGLSSVSYYCP